MSKNIFSLLFIGLLAVAVSGCVRQTVSNANVGAGNSRTTVSQLANQNVSNLNQSVNGNVNTAAATNTTAAKSEFVSSLDRPSERITKKPFGIYITPATSPVQPERFSGYHTGADFEILAGEESVAVTVKAFCSGQVIYKQRVSGYGGVLIQQCTVDNQTATVLYGHLKLASIEVGVGGQLVAGEAIGELGQAGSYDTDGERKHLHFGIHRGSTVNVRGYVNRQNDLDQWINYTL